LPETAAIAKLYAGLPATPHRKVGDDSPEAATLFKQQQLDWVRAWQKVEQSVAKLYEDAKSPKQSVAKLPENISRWSLGVEKPATDAWWQNIAPGVTREASMVPGVSPNIGGEFNRFATTNLLPALFGSRISAIGRQPLLANLLSQAGPAKTAGSLSNLATLTNQASLNPYVLLALQAGTTKTQEGIYK
jgi:hypothetical protein